ncbi:MAG: hypothetical protein Q4G34_07290 [Micrococcus sp.]|nr:hypothetical protein [Micrococcus sp.]
MKVVMFCSHQVPTAGTVTADCLDLLRGWGVEVELVMPETLVDLSTLRSRADLYLLKSVDDHVVGLAAGLEARGARCLNPTSVVRLCRDRVAATAVLVAAGVPVPQSWTTSDLPSLAPLLEDGPVIVKTGKVRGGMGPRVIWDAEELSEISLPGRQWLVQRLAQTEVRDRKIYRIGEQAFGVKRRWPAASLADKHGEPFTVTAEHRALSDAVAEALGTDLFGMDVVESAQGPLVVDVHPFPSFKGVPQGALRLADYIYDRLTQEGS